MGETSARIRPSAYERRIALCLDRGELRAAAETAVRDLGPEIFGYLVAVLRDEELAREAFADTAEQIWTSLPRFRRACSFRTWAYRLAWRSVARQRRARRRERARVASGVSMSELAAPVRSITASYRRTDAKDALARIRESLPEADQTLLILRVDRGMRWADLARVLGVKDEAVLRKRFERIKRKIRDEAVRQGIVATQGEH